MKTYLKAWNLMRIFRLAIGVFLIVQGMLAKDWLFVGAGFLFSLMPIMNIGCCSASGCNTPVRKNTGNVEDISYEEVR